jgi:cysteine/O-acetylserine efflux protein
MIDFPAMILYLAATAFTPGPNNLMCMYLGANYGLKGSRKFIVASMGSVFVKALLCGLLNVALAAVIPSVVPVLKWAGAAYMLYLAWTMLKSGTKKEEAAEKQGESTYSAGILLQILNMKMAQIILIGLLPYHPLLSFCMRLSRLIELLMLGIDIRKILEKKPQEQLQKF